MKREDVRIKHFSWSMFLNIFLLTDICTSCTIRNLIKLCFSEYLPKTMWSCIKFILVLETESSLAFERKNSFPGSRLKQPLL